MHRPRETAYKRIEFLNQQMEKTDSDTFEYFALLEIEELENFVKKYQHTNT